MWTGPRLTCTSQLNLVSCVHQLYASSVSAESSLEHTMSASVDAGLSYQLT